jgi:hypothetical protein
MAIQLVIYNYQGKVLHLWEVVVYDEDLVVPGLVVTGIKVYQRQMEVGLG